MSDGAKIALGVGGAAVLALVVVLVMRAQAPQAGAGESSSSSSGASGDTVRNGLNNGPGDSTGAAFAAAFQFGAEALRTTATIYTGENTRARDAEAARRASGTSSTSTPTTR